LSSGEFAAKFSSGTETIALGCETYERGLRIAASAIGGRLKAMANASGGGPDAGPGRRWEVALSCAGAQRDYVKEVAQALQARGVRCFYDADEEIDLWGKYLAEELPAIYGEQAASVVVFVSAEYAARDWTRFERRAALARAVRERREYVLPVRFDDTPLPGLLSDMVTVDLRTRTPRQFAAMIADKLAALDITGPASTAAAGNSPGPEIARPAGAVQVAEDDPLKDLPVAAAQGRSAYWGTVREIRQRTAVLTGRQAELAAIASFAVGDEGYLWLAGHAYAGKTALLAEAVMTLPENVDVVSYFISRREADADSPRFLAAVVPQLAALLDEEPPVADLHHFRAMWQQAAERAGARGRHLLLVVDGLMRICARPGCLVSRHCCPPARPAGRMCW
jgi:hypothetical protein